MTTPADIAQAEAALTLKEGDELWWNNRGVIMKVRVRILKTYGVFVQFEGKGHEFYASIDDLYPTEAAAIQAGITWAEEQASYLKIRLSRVCGN